MGKCRVLSMADLAPHTNTHTHTPGMKMKYENEAGSVEAKRVAGRVCREKAGHG